MIGLSYLIAVCDIFFAPDLFLDIALYLYAENIVKEPLSESAGKVVLLSGIHQTIIVSHEVENDLALGGSFPGHQVDGACDRVTVLVGRESLMELNT